jgi:hypothetical protein
MHSDEAVAAPETVSAPPQTPAWRRKWLTRRFLLVSLAAHFLFAGGATLWVVQTRHATPKRTFRSGSLSPNPATRAFEHQVQMKKKKSMNAPVTAKRVTTTGLAKIALPAMPALPAMSTLADLSPAQMPGMSGAGAGMGLGGPSMGTGFANASSGIFTSSIGGLNIRAQRLAVALDISGSVSQYKEEMAAYVTKTFKGSEVAEFKSAGFYQNKKKDASIGSVLLDYLNSPKKFDAIYIFSDFGDTWRAQTQWLEVQKLVEQKKVRLYLHVLREPGKEANIDPTLADVIAFARKTGGNVKVGQMTRVGGPG